MPHQILRQDRCSQETTSETADHHNLQTLTRDYDDVDHRQEMTMQRPASCGPNADSRLMVSTQYLMVSTQPNVAKYYHPLAWNISLSVRTPWLTFPNTKFAQISKKKNFGKIFFWNISLSVRTPWLAFPNKTFPQISNFQNFEFSNRCPKMVPFLSENVCSNAGTNVAIVFWNCG